MPAMETPQVHIMSIVANVLIWSKRLCPVTNSFATKTNAATMATRPIAISAISTRDRGRECIAIVCRGSSSSGVMLPIRCCWKSAAIALLFRALRCKALRCRSTVEDFCSSEPSAISQSLAMVDTIHLAVIVIVFLPTPADRTKHKWRSWRTAKADTCSSNSRSHERALGAAVDREVLGKLDFVMVDC